MFPRTNPPTGRTSAAVSTCGLMLTALCSLLPLQSTEAIDGKHVNAYVVTSQYRSGSKDWGSACVDCDDGWAGNIELVTVRNGSVTRVDTIWNRTQGLGQYPAFDVNAERIAFYRWDKAVVSNTTSRSANGGANTVAVMNRDGSGVRNLVTLRGQPFTEMALNWPVGDWVYYINPRAGTRDDYRVSSELRRVNVVSSADELVYDWTANGKYFRRFELSADGRFAGFQTYPISGMAATPNYDLNGVYAFPPARGSFPQAIVSFNGCNASVSSSGLYGSSYFAGNHTEMNLQGVGNSFGFWIPLYDKTVDQANWNQLYPNRGNVNEWLAPYRPSFTGSVLNNSMGAECMRFAANSDKWILQQVEHYGLNEGSGNNCVATNWKDKAAFFVSHNVKLPPDTVGHTGTGTGIIYHGNCTGDMWVDGGVDNRGKYEDSAGVWHAVNGYVPIARTLDISQRGASERIAGSSAGVQLMLPAGVAASVRVIDMLGRYILRREVVGSTLIQDTRLSAGAYTVIAECEGAVYSGRVTLAR